MFRKETYHRVFNINGCLTEQGLEKLVSGKSSRAEKKLIAAHLEECDFCREAVQGLKDKNLELSVTFSLLNERLNKRYITHNYSHFKRNKPRVSMGNFSQNFLFASIIFILFFVSLFFLKDQSVFEWKRIFNEESNKSLKRKRSEKSVLTKYLDRRAMRDNEAEWTQLSDGRIVYFKTEGMPQFKHEDYKSFEQYLVSNISFPKGENLLVSGGLMHVQFLVNKSGFVEMLSIVKGLEEPYNNEMRRVVLNSPKWLPGRHKDVPVNVVVNYKFNFSKSYVNSKKMEASD